MLRAIIVERADCAAMENVIEWLRGSGFARAETALWGGKTVKHLNRSIMEDYEIISSRPERLCAVIARRLKRLSLPAAYGESEHDGGESHELH